MAGRPSKPVQLIKSEGNTNRRTKKELDYREKAEKALYTGTTFREDPATKSDPVAHKEFLRLRKLYKQIEFVDGLDQQVINRYCQLRSQEEALHELYLSTKAKMDDAEDVINKLSVFDALEAVMTKQNQLRDKLLKLEDRLFLNPVARMRAIPKQPPEDEAKEDPMAKLFQKRGG